MNRRLALRIVVALSLALPPLALLGAIRSERLRAWTASVLESTSEVQHRKAVLAARAGRFDESFALFEQALGGGRGDPAWAVDYVRALSWAGRHADVLRLCQRLPQEVRAQPEVLAAEVDALAETGAHESVPGALTRMLDGEHARRLREELASRRHGAALRCLREGLRGRAEQAAWAERHLADALRWSAVSVARAGNPEAGLAALDEIAGAVRTPEPELVGDQLVLLCWAGRANEAFTRFASLPAGLELPDYALTSLVHAWHEEERTALLPDDALARLLERTLSAPDVASELVEGCRSVRQLDRARASLPAIARGAGPLADRLGRDVDRRIAVLMARQGRHGEAVSLLVPLLARHPDDDQARADLVTILSWAGRHAEAVRWASPPRGGARLPEYALRALQRSRAALGHRKSDERSVDRRDRPAPELARAAEPDSLLSRARRAHHAAMALARRGEHEKALASLDSAMEELDSAARRRAPSRPRRGARGGRRRVRGPSLRARPGRRGRVASACARWVAALAIVASLLSLAPRARAETAPARREHRVAAGPAAASDGRDSELRRLRLAVAWDRVVVLSWAGKHWEAIEAFEALPEPHAAPSYVAREAAESYRATYRPGAALELYASILARDPGDAQALDGLRGLLLEQMQRLFEPGLSRLGERETAPPAWLEGRAWVDPRHGVAVQAARKGDPAAALRAVREALQHASADRAVLEDYLVLLYLSRRFPEVAALARAVPGRAPGSVEPLVCAAHAARGQLEEALSEARRWRGRTPEDPRAQAALVHRLLARGLSDEAKSFVERLPPGAAERLAADVLLHERHAVEAEARYRARLGAEPGDAEATMGLAAALAMQGRDAEAETRAAAALKRLSAEEYVLHHALSPPAALALARTLNRMRRASDALDALAPLLAAHPDHVEALWALAQARELRQERLEAVQAYDRILRLVPRAPRATEARARLLLELTWTGPARAEIRTLKRPAPALESSVTQAQAVKEWSRADPEAGAPPPWSDTRQAIQLALARRLVLENRARATLATLREMTSRGAALQDTALRAAADAHAQLDEPARALELYRALDARLEAHGATRAERFDVRLAQVRCLSKAMRFAEAGALLDQMDADADAALAQPDPRKQGWGKAELAVERGWWLVAQDRLADAEEHFALLLRLAPQSAAALSGLADSHRLRGWPRRAQREYEEASSVYPDDVDLRVGLAQALDAKGEQARAERIAAELAYGSPDNAHVADLARRLEVARKLELSTAAEANVRPGVVDGFESRLGFHKPVAPRADLGVEAGWKREGRDGEAVDRGRARLSGRFGPYQGLTLALSASNEPSTQTWGAAGEVRFDPTDQLSFAVRGDSDTWSLPPGAVQARVSGREVEATAEYRYDVAFAVETRLRALGLTDGNTVVGGEAGARLQVLATGRWRAVMGLSGGEEASRLEQAEYYSPARTRFALLSTALEHVWLRSRSYGLRDRWKLEGGMDYESSFGVGERWLVGYEQSHVVGDAFELQAGAELSRRRYSGVPELGWRFVLGSAVRF